MTYHSDAAMTILDRIKARIVEDGICWVWQLGCANGHPAIRFDGKTQLVRRLVWEAVNGPIPPGKIVRMTCGTIKCVCPDCMTLTTHRRLNKEMGALGLMSGPVRSAAIARAKRVPGIAKITMEIAREIRASSESGAELARRYGTNQPKVSAIRLGKTWREYENNPFLGLMR